MFSSPISRRKIDTIRVFNCCKLYQSVSHKSQKNRLNSMRYRSDCRSCYDSWNWRFRKFTGKTRSLISYRHCVTFPRWCYLLAKSFDWKIKQKRKAKMFKENMHIFLYMETSVGKLCFFPVESKSCKSICIQEERKHFQPTCDKFRTQNNSWKSIHYTVISKGKCEKFVFHLLHKKKNYYKITNNNYQIIIIITNTKYVKNKK